MPAVDLKSAFGTQDPSEIKTRLEALKAALDAAPNTNTGFTPNLPNSPASDSPVAQFVAASKAIEGLVGKGVSSETLTSLATQLAAAQADVVKDLTLTSPISTGLVQYDLEAPSAR